MNQHARVFISSQSGSMEESNLPQRFPSQLPTRTPLRSNEKKERRTKKKEEQLKGESKKETNSTLKTELGAPPVPPLGVITDLVVSPETDPLGDRTVLVGLLGQLLLGAESLLGRHRRRCWRGKKKREKGEKKWGSEFLDSVLRGRWGFCFWRNAW